MPIEGNVQLVDPHDEDAKGIGGLAANQNQVKFISIGLGYEIVLSEGRIYHLIILAKDGEELIFFLTIVETFPEPVVLLYKTLQFSFTESHPNHHHLLIGNHPHVKAAHAPPVQYVNNNDPNVVGAAKLAATQHGWDLVEVSVGFQITFSRGPEGAFYHLVSLGKDSNGDSKFFFTAVETFFIPVVLLFTELSPSDPLQMGGDKGEVLYVDPNDDDAKSAARLATEQKELEFVAINSGFKIIFSDDKFYHLHISAKNKGTGVCEGEPKSLFAIVAVDSGGRKVVLWSSFVN